jgi:hypothetical protein
MKRQNIRFLLGTCSVGIGALSFYLLFNFAITDINIQKIFLDTNTSDIFIPNYYTHAFKIIGILFISSYISLIVYRWISKSNTKNRVGPIILISGLACLSLHVSLPFTVFRTDSFVTTGLFSKKQEMQYSQLHGVVINSVITYHRGGGRGSGGGCSLEHGISFPGVMNGEIVLRGNNHQKIKLIRDYLVKHRLEIAYASSIEQECVDKFSPDYVNKLKDRFVEDLSY